MAALDPGKGLSTVADELSFAMTHRQVDPFLNPPGID